MMTLDAASTSIATPIVTSDSREAFGFQHGIIHIKQHHLRPVLPAEHRFPAQCHFQAYKRTVQGKLLNRRPFPEFKGAAANPVSLSVLDESHRGRRVERAIRSRRKQCVMRVATSVVVGRERGRRQPQTQTS